MAKETGTGLRAQALDLPTESKLLDESLHDASGHMVFMVTIGNFQTTIKVGDIGSQVQANKHVVDMHV